MKWVGIQRDQFRRLGDLGRLGEPLPHARPPLRGGRDRRAGRPRSTTGTIFRQLKPIHWCFTDRTALAEAELEYSRRDLAQPLRQLSRWWPASPRPGDAGPWHAMIWTTTPWTLPANVAIAAHSDLVYVRRSATPTPPRRGRSVQTILAADLVAEKVLALARRSPSFEELGRCQGA